MPQDHEHPAAGNIPPDDGWEGPDPTNRYTKGDWVIWPHWPNKWNAHGPTYQYGPFGSLQAAKDACDEVMAKGRK